VTTRFTVTGLRSGQPRAYADTIREYLVSVETMSGSGTTGTASTYQPWLMYGDIDATVAADSLHRPASTWDDWRRAQREWAKTIVRALCQDFRESSDQDGRTGMEAHVYPTLKSLVLDLAAGTIRALIVEPYTD
jgi:hypothetical protein